MPIGIGTMSVISDEPIREVSHDTSDPIDDLFYRSRTKVMEFDYSSSKKMARLRGIDVTKVRNCKEDNKTLLHSAAGYGRTSWVEGLIADGANVNVRDDKGWSPLHAACNHAHKKIAMLLLEAGADVNQVDHKGRTALYFTISPSENGVRVQPHYWEVVELLIFYGADPYLKFLSGKKSLDYMEDARQRLAVRIIYLLRRLEDIDTSCPERQVIIDKHLRVNDFFELVKSANDDFINYDSLSTQDIIERLVTPRLLRSRLESCDNITPLHRAAGHGHLELAQMFIENGANPNNPDGAGRIPLHNASVFGHIEVIELLIESGSDVNKQDAQGLTPLHVAAQSDTDSSFMACLLLIERGANKEIKTLEGQLPVDLAETEQVKKVLSVDRIRMIPSTSEQAFYADFEGAPGTQLDAELIETYQHPLMLDSDSSEPLFRNEQYDMKIKKLDSSDPKYQLVAQRMSDTIVHHANDLGGRFRSYEIISIEHNLNKRVWSKYRLACQRLEIDHGPGSKNEKLLFHGSNSVSEIQSRGFNEGFAVSKGMFGAGLYFAAHSSKSNQYAFGFGQGCKKHDDKSCYVCERKMIYAQVALGKSLTSKEAIPDIVHVPPGYNSVNGQPGTTDGLMYPEYVIYTGDQAYPLFVITYRIKPD